MTTTAIQFTPEVATVAGLFAGNVAGSGKTANPQPVLTMTPTVLSNGIPVTPSSLVIDSLPAHGTASVVGVSLAYQANPGYSGPDSFTFHAIVGGNPSNVATATTRMVFPRPIEKLQNLLAYLYTDNLMDCYVRSDDGPLDLTGYVLTAHIRPYTRPQPSGLDYGVGAPGYFVPWHTEIPATQAETGHVQFTIDHGTIRSRMGAGLWRLQITAVDPSTNGRTAVYHALIQVQ